MSCRKSLFIPLLIAVILVLGGCGGKKPPAESGSAPASASADEKTQAPSKEPAQTPAAETGAHESAAETHGSDSPAATGSPSPAPSASPTPAPTPTTDPKGMAVDGWIAGIPAYVPKFSYGKLDITSSKVVEGSISSVFGLCFNGVTKADVDAYAELLKAQGYTVATAEINETYTLTASLEHKDKREVATLVITLNESKGIAIFTLGAAV